MRKKLVWIILVMLAFGLVMLSSAGIVDGQKKFGSPYYYVKHQFLFGILPGLALAYLLSKIDFRLWRKVALPILFGALGLMILVFVPGFGLALKGARSWIHVGGYTFQPAEFLKLALVIYLAAWFGGRDDRTKNWTYGLVPFFAVLGFIALLLMRQPDVGTLGIVIAIALGIYFVAGIAWKDLAILIAAGALLLAGLIWAAPYRIDRIKAFLDPSIDPRGISYQVNQSLIAIGSGGLFGVGFGHSTQKFGFLPETVGDSIFAIIVEELGYVGGLFTIGLFLALSYLLSGIARQSGDRFAALYVMGVNTWIVSQAFVNIAAVSGIGPLTGLPLPFISYGGTALIALLASLGIVLNIAKKD